MTWSLALTAVLLFSHVPSFAFTGSDENDLPEKYDQQSTGHRFWDALKVKDGPFLIDDNRIGVLEQIREFSHQRITLGEHDPKFNTLYGSPAENGRNGIGQRAAHKIKDLATQLITAKESPSIINSLVQEAYQVRENLHQLCKQQQKRAPYGLGLSMTTADIQLHSFVLDLIFGELNLVEEHVFDIRICKPDMPRASIRFLDFFEERRSLNSIGVLPLTPVQRIRYFVPESVYPSASLACGTRSAADTKVGVDELTPAVFHRFKGGCNRQVDIFPGPRLHELKSDLKSIASAPEKEKPDLPKERPSQSFLENKEMNFGDRAYGTLEEPTGIVHPRNPEAKHMILPEGVTHVISSLAEAGDAMGSRSLPNGIKVQSPQYDKSGESLNAALSSLGIESLLNKSDRRVPLLVKNGIVFRPHRVCVFSEGECQPVLENPWGEQGSTVVDLIPSISPSALETLKTHELSGNANWVIQYSALTDLGHLKNLAAIQKNLEFHLKHVVHPGNSGVLAHLTAGLRTGYLKKTNSPSLMEFVDLYGLGNCQMAAIANSQRRNGLSSVSGTHGILLAHGSYLGSDDKTVFVDFDARNHAWNLVHNGTDPHSIVSMDLTPGSVMSHVPLPSWAGHDFKFPDYAIEEAVITAVIRSIERVAQSKPNRELVNQLKEGKNVKALIPRTVEYLLKSKDPSLLAVAQFLIGKVDSGEDQVELLRVLEAHPISEFQKEVAALRGNVAEHFVQKGQLDNLRELLESGKPIEYGLFGQRHMTNTAIYGSNVPILKYLVQNHRFPLVVDESSENVLTGARSLEMVRTLIDLGADVRQKDKYGRTLAHHATIMKNLNLLRVLKEKNFPLNTPDNSSETPLSLARKQLDSYKEDLKTSSAGESSVSYVKELEEIVEFLVKS